MYHTRVRSYYTRTYVHHCAQTKAKSVFYASTYVDLPAKSLFVEKMQALESSWWLRYVATKNRYGFIVSGGSDHVRLVV